METCESVVALKGAAESLLLPLASRAFESTQAQPIIRDDKAVELLSRLAFDATPLTQNGLYHTIICLRTQRFDVAVADFLRVNPEGTVVNLGCGLDTRFERVDNGRATWLEVDLPEVIELRRKLLPESSRRHFVGCSVTDHSWLDALAGRTHLPALFLAEGVFMFIEGDEVKRLFLEIARRFPGNTLLFDAVKPIEVTLRRYHPTLRRTQAALRWGLGSAKQVEEWHPSLRVVEEWFYCDEAEPRLGWYRWLRYLPWIGRTARILRFELAALHDDRAGLPA